MITKRVLVTQQIEVSLDETKFTPEFMAEFSRDIFQTDSLDDHFKHLAQLCARGIFDGYPSDFVEGYGELDEMGIRCTAVEQYEEIVA